MRRFPSENRQSCGENVTCCIAKETGREFRNGRHGPYEPDWFAAYFGEITISI